MKLIRKFLSKNYTPRWLILQIDLVFCFLSVILAYLLRFNFKVDSPDFKDLPQVMVFFLAVRLSSFLITKIYHGVIRYTSTQDAKRIFISLTGGSVFISAFNIIYFYNQKIEFVPFSIIIFEYFSTALMMSLWRSDGIGIVFYPFIDIVMG